MVIVIGRLAGAARSMSGSSGSGTDDGKEDV